MWGIQAVFYRYRFGKIKVQFVFDSWIIDDLIVFMLGTEQITTFIRCTVHILKCVCIESSVILCTGA